MFILDVAGSNQINSSVLLSGALGAIFATALNMLWAKHLDTTKRIGHYKPNCVGIASAVSP